MKYTKEERLEIGREIYDKEINKEGAAVKYHINVYTARDYLRYYKAWLNAGCPDEDAGKETPVRLTH